MLRSISLLLCFFVANITLAGQTYLEEMNAQANKKSGWFNKHYIPVPIDQVSSEKPVPENIAIYLAADMYLIDERELNAYLTGLKDKLLSQWQGKKPEILVLAESKEHPDLRADIKNQIIISTAALRAIKSEDQLAGMLAHEVSHLLLNHNHDKSVYAELVPGFLEATGLASLLYKSHEAKKDNKALSDQRVYELMLSTNTAAWVWSDLISPAWDRKHEQAADKMGLDLMIRAGYNPAAYVYALQNLALITEKKTERLQYLKSVAVDETARRAPTARTGTELDGWIASTELEFKRSAVESMFDSMAIFSIDHDPADVREQAIKQYMATAYADAGFFPAIKTAAYDRFKKGSVVGQLLASDNNAVKARQSVLQDDVATADKLSASALNYKNRNEVFVRVIRNEVRLAQAQPEKARQNLELALQQPLATKSVYSNLAQMYLLRNDPIAAEQVLLQAFQRLGTQPGLYPALVVAARAQQDIPKAEQYVKDCKGKSKITRVVTDFFKKGRGLNVQETLHEQCVAALGYDPEKKAQPGNKGLDNKLDGVKDKFKSIFG